MYVDRWSQSLSRDRQGESVVRVGLGVRIEVGIEQIAESDAVPKRQSEITINFMALEVFGGRIADVVSVRVWQFDFMSIQYVSTNRYIIVVIQV